MTIGAHGGLLGWYGAFGGGGAAMADSLSVRQSGRGIRLQYML